MTLLSQIVSRNKSETQFDIEIKNMFQSSIYSENKLELIDFIETNPSGFGL
jgi:hypothetical protein